MVDGDLVVMYDVNREEKVGELQVGAYNSQGPALPEPKICFLLNKLPGKCLGGKLRRGWALSVKDGMGTGRKERWR